jgi:hypothetical protein
MDWKSRGEVIGKGYYPGVVFVREIITANGGCLVENTKKDHLKVAINLMPWGMGKSLVDFIYV